MATLWITNVYYMLWAKILNLNVNSWHQLTVHLYRSDMTTKRTSIPRMRVRVGSRYAIQCSPNRMFFPPATNTTTDVKKINAVISSLWWCLLVLKNLFIGFVQCVNFSAVLVKSICIHKIEAYLSSKFHSWNSIPVLLKIIFYSLHLDDISKIKFCFVKVIVNLFFLFTQ